MQNILKRAGAALALGGIVLGASAQTVSSPNRRTARWSAARSR